MTTDEAYDNWWAATPENKLELVDGQLIISSLAGSRRIAYDLLQDYGPALVLPHAPANIWWAALRHAFNPQPVPPHALAWTEWADALAYDPEPPHAGPFGSSEHSRLFGLLNYGLHGLYRSGGFQALGRDFVIRLGDNGLTPDQIVIAPERLDNLHEYYFDGPPTIVIEITLPGTADYDRVFKRRLYEQAGVPEYWLFEPETRQATFWRLGADGRYSDAAVGRDDIFFSTALPGLALSLSHLWLMDDTDWQQPHLPFLRANFGEEYPPRERRRDKGGLRWDTVPFAPRVELQPVLITFEEFASWCPQAKFESYGGGMKIGGSEGTRRVMGLLMMTLGMVDIVKLAHPREWIMFLDRERYRDVVDRHTQTILGHATYKKDSFGQKSYIYGHVDALDLSADGDTRDECQHALTKKVEDWVLLRLAREEAIPDLS